MVYQVYVHVAYTVECLALIPNLELVIMFVSLQYKLY